MDFFFFLSEDTIKVNVALTQVDNLNPRCVSLPFSNYVMMQIYSEMQAMQ